MADDRVSIEVGGRVVDDANPLPTKAGSGADIGGGKTLADIYTELTTLAGAKALSDVVTAVTALEGGSSKTLTDLVAAVVAAQAATTVANFPADQKVHADNLDIATTALRDALRGGSSKTLTDVVAAIVAAQAATTVLGTVTANLQPVTSGGLSILRVLDLGTTGQVAKNGAGQLYGYFLANRSSAERFVKIYDKGTAPTSADTPVLTLPLPAFSSAVVERSNGVAFANGISARGTTGVADNDNNAPTANDVVANLYFK